jgi:hypothetical protein
VKTVLTGELAEKRAQIAKSHNLRVVGFLGAASIALLTFSGVQHIFLFRFSHASVLLFLCALIISEAYAIYRTIQHDNQMCRDLGFICPFCHQPLYEARALIWNTLCPKCGKDIAETQHPQPDSRLPAPARR